MNPVDVKLMTGYALFSRIADVFTILLFMWFTAVVIFPWITELFHISFGR
jgi:hypothetical protein